MYPLTVQMMSTTPSATCRNSCGGEPPSDMAGKISIFTRPPEVVLDRRCPGFEHLGMGRRLGPEKVVELQFHFRALRPGLPEISGHRDDAGRRGKELPSSYH